MIGFGAFMAAFPQISPMGVDAQVADYYSFIENIPDGSVFLLSSSSNLATTIALRANQLILWQHLFLKPNIKLLIYSLTSTGAVNVEGILRLMPQSVKSQKTYGVDYVVLGYIPGDEIGLASIFSNIRSAITEDYYGNPLDSLPMMTSGHPDTAGPINDATAYYACYPTHFSATFIEAYVRVAGETWGVQIVKPNMGLQAWGFNAPFIPRYITHYYLTDRHVEYEYLVGIPGINMAYYSARFYFSLFFVGLIVVLNVAIYMEQRAERILRSVQQ
jgi:hypothetical protein